MELSLTLPSPHNTPSVLVGGGAVGGAEWRRGLLQP